MIHIYHYIVHCQHAMLYIYSISIKLGRGIGDLKSVEKEKDFTASMEITCLFLSSLAATIFLWL